MSDKEPMEEEMEEDQEILPLILAENNDWKALQEKLSARSKMDLPEVLLSVQNIVTAVKESGIEAALAYTRQFDSLDLQAEHVEVMEDEINRAVAKLDASLLRRLEEAAQNIRTFHEAQMNMEQDLSLYPRPDCRLQLLRRPLERVGMYVPGGTAPLPSSVLMNAIPAKAAGVRELIMCTPPQKDGSVAPLILAAARLGGVDRIFKLGGAQAIAAMAYGAAPLPQVDKICGPGNIYVNSAKRLVFGTVDIDMFAGPSEILVIADHTANPCFVARDLCSQAEHDVLASAILLTDSLALAKEVRAEVLRLLKAAPRQEILRRSLADYGAIVVTRNLEEALALSNDFAPEHLELCVNEEQCTLLLPQVRHAGAVFLGYYSPEPLGDYWAGPNHVLPTSGTARFSSPLSTGDFMRKMSVIHYSQEALEEAADAIVKLAEAEGLYAHAAAISIRQNPGKE